MKSNKALSWWPALLLLAGCGGPPKPEPEAPRLDKVAVTCAPAALTAGQSTQCSASATDQFGAPFSVSAFSWSSGDTSIARVDSSSGKVSTEVLSSGSVAIRAQAAGSTTQGEAALAVAPKPPTVHSTPVTSAETWKALDNPHLVTGSVSVDAAVALTLEKGAVIRFAPDAELKVARGSLQAAGTATEPVLLQAQNGGRGTWKGLVLAAKDAASSLEFVTLSGCGGPQGAGACLVIRDGAVPVLKNVTVKDSGSVGVLVATADSAFGPGSANLSVSGSASLPVRLPANQAGTLPTGGTFTNNTPNAVDLTGSTVTRTQTWPNPTIPYLVTQNLSVDNEQASIVLTLAAGTQVRLGPSVKWLVGLSSEMPGALVLEGTAKDPILLTAHSDTPQPGHWRGLHVRSDAANRFAFTTIEYAGRAPAADETFASQQGNLNLYYISVNPLPPRTTFTDLTVRKSGGSGLTSRTEFAAGCARLTSVDNATYPIEMPANGIGGLPTEVTFKNNGSNKVAITNGSVTSTQTWRNLGLPYLLLRDLFIGSKDNPTLTLEPGTEIRTAPNTAIVVGAVADSSGALVAKGTGDTAETSIRFIPDAASPARGYWNGINFWYATGSRLDHVLVTHGGADGNSNIAQYTFGICNISVYTNGPGSFVTNSRFESGLVCAVSRSNAVTTRLNAASFNNRFTNNDINNECVND